VFSCPSRRSTCGGRGAVPVPRDGIVARTVHEQVPPKVVYSLTPRGVALNQALEPLGEWGEANMDHIVATRGS
jgi:DNA-binding HxlR family transcriptional regulator